VTWDPTFDVLVTRAQALAGAGKRRILGLVGAPGIGKSTLAAAVVRAMGPSACYVPMDGFHLANVELEQRCRRARKGAPETFDADGYVALLRRLRDNRDAVVYAPSFRRELDEPVAAAIAVSRETPLVVTEGNYLLFEHGPWAGVKDLLDEAWYVEGDEDRRVELLVRRHISYGMAPDAARVRAQGSDQHNAELVLATRHHADLVVYDHHGKAGGACG
jgi:pantothenate kinase